MPELRVLTFNVLQLPFVSAWPSGIRRAGLAAELIGGLAPDVVVLNEAFGLSAAGLLVRRLTSGGYHTTPQVGALRGRSDWHSRTEPDSPVRGLVGGGVRVLSRHRILRQHQHVYRAYRRHTQDAWSAKGVALVELDVPGSPVWLAATHLQADEPPTPVAATHDVRLHQLAELRRVVAATVPPYRAVLLAGDLNVEYYQSDVDGVPGEPGPDPEAAAAAVGGRVAPDGAIHAHTFDGARNPLVARSLPRYRNVLDYVGSIDENGQRPVPHITTSTIPFEPGRAASDHYPVLAEITWEHR
ncbi:MAG: Endonuclease/exonuclease/phosphatase family metal-dependent hydrolase [Amycolatopsis sp.]|jgi:endonuclease/exonuclease/phosphatase family metal-dependent hydrolase|uniref:sphingomyelin phosphodiesterase n=1 Tax=Amycolatopsis sp. TaxID=37632 RepID=UPI0026348C4A|nr:sphingomyelin phosphodiesterase [Amycolatopsis sp.]MCU1682380.1 Endonuclease/exonuclease/phosphatase family metal-dependent hydrolase [Amycolatopsis sp.]